MTAPHWQIPRLEDVLSARRAEGSPPMVLVGMPETPEAVALCLMLLLLERRGGTVDSEADLLGLYDRCHRATNARWLNTDPEPYRQ